LRQQARVQKASPSPSLPANTQACYAGNINAGEQVDSVGPLARPFVLSEVTEAFTTGKINQSGNHQQERISGRTFFRDLVSRGNAPAAKGSSEPGRAPALHALRMVEVSPVFRHRLVLESSCGTGTLPVLAAKESLSPGEPQQQRCGRLASRSNRG